MGFFSNIANSMRESKEKAKLEAMQVADRIEYMDLASACRVLANELKTASSLPKRASLTQVFTEKLKKTENRDELYWAFSDMYQQSMRGSNRMYELNMAQKIGKRLYEMGDLRVEANSDETSFRPKY